MKISAPNFTLSRKQQIFLFTWLGYAGFYFCRKNFSVAMPLMSNQLGFDNMQLANLITLYSVMYMAGQFVSGFLNDRLGAKAVVGYGLVLSLAANIFMGFFPSLSFMMGCMLLNGAGQSTGWSGMIRIMSNWYEKKERGVVMGWWTTCYVVGGFVAVLFATWWGTNNILPDLGWRKVFWAPALLLAVITILFWKISGTNHITSM
ncbi:MAG: MFS transporter [Bacteroidales bacterium]|nr:MFS transporter [Bacteroidales bacterium]